MTGELILNWMTRACVIAHLSDIKQFSTSSHLIRESFKFKLKAMERFEARRHTENPIKNNDGTNRCFHRVLVKYANEVMSELSLCIKLESFSSVFHFHILSFSSSQKPKEIKISSKEENVEKLARARNDVIARFTTMYNERPFRCLRLCSYCSAFYDRCKINVKISSFFKKIKRMRKLGYFALICCLLSQRNETRNCSLFVAVVLDV